VSAPRDIGSVADDAVPPGDLPRPHASRAVRVVLVTAGTSSLALGLIGIFVPLLPTTPFVLLAAGCYARASTRLHDRLLRSRSFGPMIRELQRYRSIRYRTKLVAIATKAGSLGVSTVFFVEPTWLKAALALLGVTLAVWMYRIPSRDEPGRPASAGD
jgi:uncharacterized membrane protein YbaN (DUF454 family)